MTRVINSTQIAILYETITGQCQKRGAITTDSSADIDAFLARHHGLQAVIIAKSASQDEASFRQAIAAATGTPVFPAGADRCVQVGPTAVTDVISVHYGNVPGLDSPTGPNSLVSDLHADVNDSFSHATGSFSRRYAVVNPVTGLVVRTTTITVSSSVPTSPIPGNVLVASTTLQVGDVVPVKS